MPPSETEGPPLHRPVSSKVRRWAALTVATAWIASLAVLAIRTSNPILLNRYQILRARNEGMIVRARVIDVQTGQCQVFERWPVGVPVDTVQVMNLDQTPATTGESYLLPLLPSDGGYVVASGASPDLGPMIYPDDAVAIAQLEELLGE